MSLFVVSVKNALSKLKVRVLHSGGDFQVLQKYKWRRVRKYNNYNSWNGNAKHTSLVVMFIFCSRFLQPLLVTNFSSKFILTCSFQPSFHLLDVLVGVGACISMDNIALRIFLYMQYAYFVPLLVWFFWFITLFDLIKFCYFYKVTCIKGQLASYTFMVLPEYIAIEVYRCMSLTTTSLCALRSFNIYARVSYRSETRAILNHVSDWHYVPFWNMFQIGIVPYQSRMLNSRSWRIKTCVWRPEVRPSYWICFFGQ